MFNEPLFEKGHKFIWNGDLICVLRMDVQVGDPMAIDMWEWFVEKPSLNDPIHPVIWQECDKRINEVKNRKVVQVQ